MTEVFRCLAGSRLYGTHTAESDHDYKAVHLPSKRDILLGGRQLVLNKSTGVSDARNTAEDTDVESFELQRFLKLASDMQTIPVEMLFVMDSWGNSELDWGEGEHSTVLWRKICKNRGKILNRNTKAFVGYCKRQAVRYSMRGKRLETYEAVVAWLEEQPLDQPISADPYGFDHLTSLEGVTIIPKAQPGGGTLPYLDVYGRQAPGGIRAGEALKIYRKPVQEAGRRARDAMDAGGMDCKALYHAVRIADEGISLFSTGKMAFPCQNLPFLRRIRAAEVEIDEILDVFDEKIAILEGIGENSPLREAPDREWIDDFVAEAYEEIVRAD